MNQSAGLSTHLKLFAVRQGHDTEMSATRRKVEYVRKRVMAACGSFQIPDSVAPSEFVILILYPH
jgi:hypothetical protein